MKAKASDRLGRAGMAPFLMVVIAPFAFANLSISLSLFSSCNQLRIHSIRINIINHFTLLRKIQY